MHQSSKSFLIKKVDLTCKNKECTYITPPRENVKNTKPVPQACGRVQQRNHYQRDRVIEPVPLPPKKTNAYEELLRRTKLRKFESRDRRLQEFQHRKKLQQERKKYENEFKRQQFLLNRERMKREQAERLLEMEQRRHENRNRSFARTGRMYKDYRNYYEEESGGQVEGACYKRQVEKKNLLFSESTMSLYGVERNKLCAGKPGDLESRKFRIYLPSQKSTNPGKFTPRPQPYTGPKCHKEMLVPMEQKDTPRLQRTIPKRYSSEDLEKPSYNGPTAVSMLNEAEADVKPRNAKNCTSYKLSKSNLYAPSKIPIRRKKSKMVTKNKFVAVCECGRGITESEAQLLDKEDSEAISSTREIHCFKVHAQQNVSPQVDNIKQPHSKIPVQKPRYNEPYEKRHCKSDMKEEEGTCCTMSTASSTDPAHESKTSIKTVPSSRRTALEATLSDDTTEDGIDVNTISLTTKTLQSNPIDRTSTSVQCENSRWSQADGSGEDNYSETFMCEETSLTGLMSAASELPDVENKIVDEGVCESSGNGVQELIDNAGLSGDSGNDKENENQDEFQATQVHYANNPYTYNCTTAGRSNYNAGFPMHSRQYTNTEHTRRTPFARFQGGNEVFYQPNIVLPTPCAGPAYFPPYCPATPIYNYQWCANAEGAYADQTGIFLSTQPEVILAPCNEEYEDVIILANPYDSNSTDVPIVIFDVEEMYANQLGAIERDDLHFRSHSEMQIVEISNSNNNLKDSDQIERNHPQKYVSNEPKYQSSGEFDVSQICMHIRQIEMALKDKMNLDEFESQSIQESKPKEKRVSKNHNSREQKESIQNPLKKRKCSKSKKCQCGKRKNSPPPSEKDTPSLPSSITEPCKSMDIIINTFLVGKKTHKHCKKPDEHKKKKVVTLSSPLSEKEKTENSQPSPHKPEKPLESTSKNKLPSNEENKNIELVLAKSTLSSDSIPGTSKAGKNKPPDRNGILMTPGKTECYDFCMSLGKNESKHLEARILCTCCSCMQPSSAKHHALPNYPKHHALPIYPEERNDFDNISQEKMQFDLISIYETKSGRLEEPIKIRKRPAIIKCAENDTCCHIRRNRPRAFRRSYNSELRTSSNRAIHRNARPSKAPRQIEPEYLKWACKCTRERYLRDHSSNAKENLPPIIGCECHNHGPSSYQRHGKQNKITYNLPQNSYMYLEKITESSSKSSSRPTKRTIQRKMSTIHKRNRDRTPHRRAGQKKPKKAKKIIKKTTASGATQDENVENNGSSTVFGLYEPTEYSVVSLYRKSSDAEATFKANLFEIKRRYSHIITSSSSGFKRYSLNVLAPDNTSIRGFGVLQERNENYPNQRCPSTITMYGSERPSIDEREFENHLEMDDLNIEQLQNSSSYQRKHQKRRRTVDTEYGAEQHYFEPRKTRTSTRWDGGLYAGASYLIVPMSLSSLLQKVYSQTGDSLLKSSSSSVNRNFLNFSDHEDEPRLRGGGTYTPIFRNSQVESLIRRIAVLNNFQEAVNSVSCQILADNEKDLPIKRYMTTKIIEKGSAVLEADAIQLCNVMDELRKHRQGAVRQKAEEKFEREVRDCLYKLKAKILLRTPINLPEDLPDDLHSALDESMDSLQHTLVEKLNQLCKDNTLSTSQFLYPTQSISYSLQEILNYLGSIDTETSADLCPLEILILSNTLAKHLLNEFLV